MSRYTVILASTAGASALVALNAEDAGAAARRGTDIVTAWARTNIDGATKKSAPKWWAAVVLGVGAVDMLESSFSPVGGRHHGTIFRDPLGARSEGT